MSAMSCMPAFNQSGGALIASPNSALREQVVHRLNGRCRPVQQAWGGADALAKLEKGDWQVLFLDRSLPDLDAEELITIIQRRFPGTRVVMLDSDGQCSPGDNDVNNKDRAVERNTDEGDPNLRERVDANPVLLQQPAEIGRAVRRSPAGDDRAQ